MRFGFALVDIYDELVSTARGVPLPTIVPPAIDSFLAMADAPDRLDTAGVHEAFNYLRKGKHLEIPDRWRPYIPKQLSMMGLLCFCYIPNVAIRCMGSQLGFF